MNSISINGAPATAADVVALGRAMDAEDGGYPPPLPAEPPVTGRRPNGVFAAPLCVTVGQPLFGPGDNRALGSNVVRAAALSTAGDRCVAVLHYPQQPLGQQHWVVEFCAGRYLLENSGQYASGSEALDVFRELAGCLP